MAKFDWKFPDYGPNWDKISEQCKKRDGYKCRKCGRRGFKASPPGTSILHACHIVSRRNGGQNILTNLITKCSDCHSNEKGHSHMKANPNFKAKKRKKKDWSF